MRGIPGSRRVVIECSGHMVAMEQPAQVTTAVLVWAACGKRLYPSLVASDSIFSVDRPDEGPA